MIDNWDQFYYILNYYIYYEYNILFYTKTNEILTGFYSTIKYLLEVENLNPQEGFDKYIENLSNLLKIYKLIKNI